MKTLLDRIKYGKETVKNPLYENPYSYGKIHIEQGQCNGCKKCIEECVVSAIGLKDGHIKIEEKKCIYCKNCITACTQKALVMTPEYKLATVEELGAALAEKIYGKYKRSLNLRSVDTGSCNACMLELSNMQNTYYDLSRFGISFTASPRHADGIVVTGPVTINMREALLKTYYAMSEPRLVIAVGACAYDGGIFKDGYGNCEELPSILPVNLVIPGCPPSPQALIYGLLKLMDRI